MDKGDWRELLHSLQDDIEPIEVTELEELVEYEEIHAAAAA